MSNPPYSAHRVSDCDSDSSVVSSLHISTIRPHVSSEEQRRSSIIAPNRTSKSVLNSLKQCFLSKNAQFITMPKPFRIGHIPRFTIL